MKKSTIEWISYFLLLAITVETFMIKALPINVDRVLLTMAIIFRFSTFPKQK